MPNAIIIGATSGLGEALARELARRGYAVGLTGRRADRLQALQAELGAPCRIQAMDVSRPEEAVAQMQALIQAMGSADLIVISAGVSYRLPSWDRELETIQVNCIGFTALAKAAFEYFAKQKRGHLAAISSISGLRGRGDALVYSATKAYVSNFLQGLRQKARRIQSPMTVTDVIAGYVDTPVIQGKPHFWAAAPAKAARQIAAALQRRKNRIYITRRWFLIAWFLRLIPDWIHSRM